MGPIVIFVLSEFENAVVKVKKEDYNVIPVYLWITKIMDVRRKYDW